jgi:regulator of sirC expression with transglutaminase-like and TPR domain
MATHISSIGLMEDEDIVLDVAALALSELDHEGIDLQPYLALLQGMGERLAIIGGAARTGTEQAEALATLFRDEFGFVGDAASYDAPLNADLIRVLDRRRGLPVSLSILYVAAARRLGWTAHALNTPGHVLVHIGAEGSVVIDPFNGGVEVSHGQLLSLLHRALGASAALASDSVAAMSNRSILVRLLLNQATRAERASDQGRAMILYERMTIVAPDHADGWWQLARHQLRAGAFDDARQSLSALLEVTRDPGRRELVAGALDAIAPR